MCSMNRFLEAELGAKGMNIYKISLFTFVLANSSVKTTQTKAYIIKILTRDNTGTFFF